MATTPTPIIRKTTLRREVIKADPDYVRDKRETVEYEFSNGRKFERNQDESEIYTGG